jgi:tetratricopeptide (TPR) repeat protein
MRQDTRQWQEFLDQFSLQQLSMDEPLALDPLSRASILTQKAGWHYQTRDFAASRQEVEAALHLLNGNSNSVIMASALLTQGQLAYAQQDFTTGDRSFVSALDLLDRLNLHEELAEEAVHYADLLEAAGKVHEAFTYIRRAFQSQQKLGR